MRDRVREFIHAMIEGELDMALSRPRYARHAKSPSGEAEETVGVTGHRHGHRIAVADGKLRPGGDRGAARQAEHC